MPGRHHETGKSVAPPCASDSSRDGPAVYDPGELTTPNAPTLPSKSGPNLETVSESMHDTPAPAPTAGYSTAATTFDLEGDPDSYISAP
jgi:hypothetical protein